MGALGAQEQSGDILNSPMADPVSARNFLIFPMAGDEMGGLRHSQQDPSWATLHLERMSLYTSATVGSRYGFRDTWKTLEHVLHKQEHNCSGIFCMSHRIEFRYGMRRADPQASMHQNRRLRMGSPASVSKIQYPHSAVRGLGDPEDCNTDRKEENVMTQDRMSA